MLTLTSPVKTRYHRLPAGLKLALLALFTLALFALQGLVPLAAAAALVAALHLTGGGWRLTAAAARLLWPLWPFVVLLLGFHLWQGELAAGAAVLLRMITAVAAANLVTMTTPLSAILAALEGLFRPLSRLIPPRRLALAVALVLRFVPRFRELLQLLALAWRSRSPRRPGWRLVLPALLSALDDADRVAEALRARGGL